MYVYTALFTTADVRYPSIGAALRAGGVPVCVVSGAPMWAQRRIRLALAKQPGADVIAGRAARLEASRTSLPPSLPLSFFLSLSLQSGYPHEPRRVSVGDWCCSNAAYRMFRSKS